MNAIRAKLIKEGKVRPPVVQQFGAVKAARFDDVQAARVKKALRILAQAIAR